VDDESPAQIAGQVSALLLLVQPVALIGWVLVALAVICLRGSRSPGASWVVGFALLLYGILTTPLGADSLVYPLERAALRAERSCAAPDPPASLIAVLAGGMSAGATEPTQIEFLREASLRRALHALELAGRIDRSRVLMAGGSGGSIKEADLLEHLAVLTGLPKERLQVDRLSTDTAQTARRIAVVLRGQPSPRLLIVTSGLHMPRALAEFEAVGLRPCARPTDFRYLGPSWPGYLIPQISALQKSTDALHEYAGLVASELRIVRARGTT